MAGFHHERQVGGERPPVRQAALFLVLVRAGEGVRQLPRPLEHLPLVVRAVQHVHFARHLDELVGRVRDADELAVVDAVDAVARGADLAVHLEAATEGGAVVGGEEAEVLPWVGGWVEGLIVALGRLVRSEEGVRRSGGGGDGKGSALAVIFGELTAIFVPSRI